MQRTLWTGAAALLGLALLGSFAPARALVAVMPAPPGPTRAANADTIVVGRLLAIEDQDVEATTAPRNGAKVKYRVALLQVTEVVRGMKDLKTIRVASQAAANVGGPIGGPIRRPIRPGYGNLNLEVGMDGLFFLNKHHQEKFYVAENMYSYVNRQTADFQKQVDLTRKSLQVIENPIRALQSKDSEERLLAASILIDRYRTFRGPGAAKQEPISAEESKLILLALANADWTQQPGRYDPNGAQALFGRLGISTNDGFNPPKVVRNPQQYQQEYQQAARDWLKANADRYRIQKFVSSGNVGIDPKIQPPIQIQPRPGIQIQPRPGIQIRPLPIQIQPGRPIQVQPLPAPVEVPQPLPGQRDPEK